MKKTFAAITFAAFFAACNSNPKTASEPVSPAMDTAAMNRARLNDNAQTTNINGVSDTILASDGSQYVKVQPGATALAAEPVEKKAVTKKSTATRTKRRSSATSAGSSTSSSQSGSETVSSGETKTATTPAPAKKKGWSNAAKGTALGAGTGAVAGAIISKKKGKGAIIGGVIGGAGGYILGRSKDKKEGRTN